MNHLVTSLPLNVVFGTLLGLRNLFIPVDIFAPLFELLFYLNSTEHNNKIKIKNAKKSDQNGIKKIIIENGCKKDGCLKHDG